MEGPKHAILPSIPESALLVLMQLRGSSSLAPKASGPGLKTLNKKVEP